MVIFTLLNNVYYRIFTTWYRVASTLCWTGSFEMDQQRHSVWLWTYQGASVALRDDCQVFCVCFIFFST